MYNFLELKTKVGQLIQLSTDTDYLEKIGIWLQLSHKLLADIYDYWIDLQDIHNFSTVDGQEDYPLPNRFDKPFRIKDFTNKIDINIKTEEEYADGNLSSIVAATEGNSDTARIYGTTGVRVPISTSGDTVKFKSSYVTDPVAVVVRIEGYLDSSMLILGYENITIPIAASTTFVAGTTTFYKITHISKSVNSTGYITIANSTGTTLDTLAPNERVIRHKVLKLGLIPDGIHSLRVWFKKIPNEMVNDYDYPFTECSEYLIMDAYGYALKQQTKDQEAEYAWNKAEKILRILLTNQQSKLGPDYIHRAVSVWTSAHRR
jgi:hypothetical protein